MISIEELEARASDVFGDTITLGIVSQIDVILRVLADLINEELERITTQILERVGTRDLRPEDVAAIVNGEP